MLRSVISVCVGIVGVSFFGCAQQSVLSPVEKSVSALTTSPKTPAALTCEIARPTAIRPNSVCGMVGYQYLLTTYIRPVCGSCHSIGSFISPVSLGDSNVTNAYYAALSYATIFVERSTKNPYINKECNLQPGDPVLADLMAWTKCP